MTKLSLIPLLFLFIPSVPAAEQISETQIKAFVAKLGSEDYDERQKAESTLATVREKAQPTLEAIGDDADYEVNVRAGRLLSVIYTSQQFKKEWAMFRQETGLLFGCKDYEWRAPVIANDDTHVVSAEPALHWLAENQEEDGHWDSVKHGAQQNADIEQTAFALLAFLGAGHTEKVGMYKSKVKRAVEWLSTRVNEAGAVLDQGEIQPRGTAQALAGLAFCEAASMANLKTTKDIAQRVVDYSCEKYQILKDDGRWGFGSDLNSKSANLFITTLFTLNFKSAKIAGLRVPPATFDGILCFLNAVETKPEPGGVSKFANVQGGKTSVRSAIMGLMCRQLLGSKKEELSATARRTCVEYCNCPEEITDDLSSYFGTFVMFHQGGETWARWNESVTQSTKDLIIRGGKNHGSWDPRSAWSGAGRVFSTSVQALSLEMYYRYQLIRSD